MAKKTPASPIIGRPHCQTPATCSAARNPSRVQAGCPPTAVNGVQNAGDEQQCPSGHRCSNSSSSCHTCDNGNCCRNVGQTSDRRRHRCRCCLQVEQPPGECSAMFSRVTTGCADDVDLGGAATTTSARSGHLYDTVGSGGRSRRPMDSISSSNSSRSSSRRDSRVFGLVIVASLAAMLGCLDGQLGFGGVAAIAVPANVAELLAEDNEFLPFLIGGRADNDHGAALHPSPEFRAHQRIRPQLQHARHKQRIGHTKLQDGSHEPQITVHLEHATGVLVADLRLNDELLPAGHFLRYQRPTTGDRRQHVIRTDFNATTAELCHYRGQIRGNPDSRVALSTCHGLRGILFDGHDTFYIAAADGGSLAASTPIAERQHFLYRHADLIPSRRNSNSTSSSSGSRFGQLAQAGQTASRTKRSASSSNSLIRGPYNSNQQSSYIELVLVVDNSVYKVYNNVDKVHDYCKSITNIVNALYMPLNVFVALVGVVVWSEQDEMDISAEGETTLRAFADYRRTKLLPNHPNDNAHLLTRKKFNDDVVGKAYKGEMCTYLTSVGIAQDHSPIVGVVATTIAHEMGHNLGMEHDEENCKCVVSRCIMAASTSSEVTLHWSSCSIDQLNRAFHHGSNYCLKNKPRSLFQSPTCGNGFVESGEQCDCGTAEFCRNPCCNPDTCMLRSNASCATGSCCDLSTCRPHQAGFECRSVGDAECDLPEFCSGESEYCPADFYRRDTDVCAGGQAYCYRGVCRSHDDQCRTLWGPSGKSSEECYVNNLNGKRHGNCGFVQQNSSYSVCAKADIMCGRLQCRHLNERLEFGIESRAEMSYSYVTLRDGTSVVPCRTVKVDFGLTSVDPGLTPNGARCGEERMCVDQKCRPLRALWEQGVGRECAANCSGHGVCNNEASCHCEVGFGGEECAEPGPGGSRQSGPATNPNDGTGIVRVMYVFFLGVVPFVSLFLFFVYYWRQNRPSFLRKSANVFKSHTTKASPHRGAGGGGGGGLFAGVIGSQSALASNANTSALTSPTSTVGVLSTPSSTDDMNSALLRSSSTTAPNHSAAAAVATASAESSALNNNMFGQFKGFSLKPLPLNSRTAAKPGATNIAYVQPVAKADGVPQRCAPPVPAPPVTATKQSAKEVAAASHTSAAEFEAPALPPFNPGSTARPLISSPILEASTCSAKELISPLRHQQQQQQQQQHYNNDSNKYPVRAAPAPPPPPHGIGFQAQARPDPVPSHLSPAQLKEKKAPKESALRRLASFLSKDEARDTKPTVAAKTKPTLDKDQLRNLHISSPISSVDLVADLAAAPAASATPDQRVSINSLSRTQSMREPSATAIAVVNKRANLPQFGSMRHPPGMRPGSVAGLLTAGGNRPKSPPPPRPPVPPALPALPALPKAAAKRVNDYDRCEANDSLPAAAAPLAKIREDGSPTSADNIYAVIDEYQRPASVAKRVTPSPTPVAKSVPVPTTTPASRPASGGMGLLGEIVNEIENRNLDSIYSATSTLNRKKSRDTPLSTIPTAPKAATEPQADYSNVKPPVAVSSLHGNRPTASSAPVARVAPVNKSGHVPPPATSSTAQSPNVGQTFSSFRQKPAAPNADKSQTQAPSSSSSTNNALTNTNAVAAANTTTPFSRTRTPPSLSSSAIRNGRTRSPSPSAQKPGQKPLTSAKPATLQKPTPTKATSSAASGVAAAKALSTKPPELPKPVVSKPKPSPLSGSSFSSASVKPKWSAGPASAASPMSPAASTFGSSSSGNGKSESRAPLQRFGSGSSTGSGAGKSNQITSLQQRFESGGNSNSNNKSSTKSVARK